MPLLQPIGITTPTRTQSTPPVARTKAKPAVRPTPVSLQTHTRYTFDVNETDLSKRDTYEFTEGEFWAIIQLKNELAQKLGKKIIKRDIIRCAISLVFDEYETQKLDSRLVKYLKHKKG